MTRDEIIYHRRVRVLEHAAGTGNVAATCRTFGISRKTFYAWRAVAERYGLEALMPKARRRPQLPNTTPTHVLHELLALAVAEPTLGCRQLGDRLADRGYVVSKTTVQKLLVDHGLGRRHQRVARAAALAALVQGLVTEPVAVLSDNGPEYAAVRFKDRLAGLGLAHHRIPPRSPNHNAVCERFQGTMLQECWRPAFHRRRFSTIRQLQAEADTWLHGYHHRRRNHGDFMRGRTPRQVLAEHATKRAS